MSERLEFETPENVVVSYEPAGLGTRFLAWFVDQVLLTVLVAVLFMVALLGGFAAADAFGGLPEAFNDARHGKSNEIPLYFIAVALLVYGLSNFLYFGLSEYLTGGKTIGKHSLGIRVVKANGFALDAAGVFVRNIFRVLDHFPLLWIVPFVSQRNQRLGDLVAGTVVIADQLPAMSGLRQQLLQRPLAQSVFHFDAAMLQRARPEDFEAAEKLLERQAELPKAEMELLLARICDPLARRLQLEPPPLEQRLSFLIDFLAAELRHEQRKLR